MGVSILPQRASKFPEPNTTPALHPPAPNKDQIQFSEGLSGAYLGLIWVGGVYGQGSIGRWF